MRGVRAFFGCVGLALLAAGCTDSAYLRSGVGTDLVSDDLAASSGLQELYVGEICRQAGLRVIRQGDALYCEEVGMRPSEWATFVQAGMNDIDRRCDAYLAWIDNKRRWQEPILKQISSTAAATAAIMGLTGVGAVPIAVVGASFGFAQETFVNISSRLITEVNHSVVQSVVLDNQNQFRARIAGIPVDNRPAAIYLLRNYLRICMPFSIEMSINNTMTTYHRSGGAVLDRTEPLLNRAPTVARVTAAATHTRVSQPPPPTPAPPKIILSAIGPIESTISFGSGRAIQRALCVEDSGDFDAATRSELRNFKAASLYPTDTAASNTLTTDADLARLRSAQRMFPSCQRAGFLNGFEVGLFARYGAAKMRDDLKLALGAAGLPIPAGLNATGGPPLDNSVRQAIAGLRTKYALPGQPVFDRAFYDTMLNSMAR